MVTPEEPKQTPEFVVAEEAAKKDIDRWLDKKRIPKKKRETYKDIIGQLVDCVMDGILRVKEDGTLVQVLLFPVGKDSQITELEYKPRLTVEEYQGAIKGVKANDSDGRLYAIAAHLTGQAINIFRQLDSSDGTLGQNIASFFV